MMRIVRRVLCGWAAVLLLASPALSHANTITLLHVNDTHSHLDAVGPKDRHLDGTLGGLAKAASVIAAQKAANPGALFATPETCSRATATSTSPMGSPSTRSSACSASMR